MSTSLGTLLLSGVPTHGLSFTHGWSVSFTRFIFCFFSPFSSWENIWWKWRQPLFVYVWLWYSQQRRRLVHSQCEQIMIFSILRGTYANVYHAPLYCIVQYCNSVVFFVLHNTSTSAASGCSFYFWGVVNGRQKARSRYCTTGVFFALQSLCWPPLFFVAVFIAGFEVCVEVLFSIDIFKNSPTLNLSKYSSSNRSII